MEDALSSLCDGAASAASASKLARRQLAEARARHAEVIRAGTELRREVALLEQLDHVKSLLSARGERESDAAPLARSLQALQAIRPKCDAAGSAAKTELASLSSRLRARLMAAWKAWLTTDADAFFTGARALAL